MMQQVPEYKALVTETLGESIKNNPKKAPCKAAYIRTDKWKLSDR